MTSIPNWSEMTDSTVQPAANTTGLGASPSQTTIGDDHIAENSDVFREAIKARNIYAAWARKFTNAKPSDRDVQTYHMEVKKAENGGRKKKTFGKGLPAPSEGPPRLNFETKRKLDLTGASEMNRLYPNSRRESGNENQYLNTLPRRREDGGRSGQTKIV
ncbi:hypothetical protein TNCV_1288691 [Trichonephila clavipes]|nr:hypothetical protein TNCV_1288691 [Trichonephila clavipes]